MHRPCAHLPRPSSCPLSPYGKVGLRAAQLVPTTRLGLVADTGMPLPCWSAPASNLPRQRRTVSLQKPTVRQRNPTVYSKRLNDSKPIGSARAQHRLEISKITP